MRNIIYLLTTVAFLNACNSCSSPKEEYTFVVKGIGYDELEGKKLYLWKISDMISPEDPPIDSAIVVNGEFQFHGIEDTLHIYFIDHVVRFFPERGTNIFDPVHPCWECTPRNKKYWELVKGGLPPKEMHDFMKENIGNAMGVFVFDRWSGAEPQELEELYQKTSKQMRPYFPLNNLRKQLDNTPALAPGTPFIDFEKTDLRGRRVKLSEIAGKGDPVCLMFLFDINEKEHVRKNIEDLYALYPAMKTILFSYVNMENKPFEKEMLEKERVYWIYDERHYEESVHYQYRVHPPINYRVLISPDGKVEETKTLWSNQ